MIFLIITGDIEVVIFERAVAIFSKSQKSISIEDILKKTHLEIYHEEVDIIQNRYRDDGTGNSSEHTEFIDSIDDIFR